MLVIAQLPVSNKIRPLNKAQIRRETVPQAPYAAVCIYYINSMHSSIIMSIDQSSRH